jgi:hypothetical protein
MRDLLSARIKINTYTAVYMNFTNDSNNVIRQCITLLSDNSIYHAYT